MDEEGRPADGIGRTPPWWRRQRLPVTLAIITGIVVMLAAGGITAYLRWPHSPASQTRTAQTVLPFTGLNNPSGVAVDAAGNVYVSDSGGNRVLKLGVTR